VVELGAQFGMQPVGSPPLELGLARQRGELAQHGKQVGDRFSRLHGLWRHSWQKRFSLRQLIQPDGDGFQYVPAVFRIKPAHRRGSRNTLSQGPGPT
jgi:hypothetical protein